MKTTTPLQLLADMGACSDAVAFVRDGKFETLQAAWNACPRGDWLLWFAGKKSGEPESEKRRKLVLAACECARLALPIFEKRYPDDKRAYGAHTANTLAEYLDHCGYTPTHPEVISFAAQSLPAP